MQVFIFRHGQAEILAARDQDRALTPRGRQDVAQVVRYRLQELSNIERILVSPILRAQQTATIVCEHLPNKPIEFTELLLPDADPLELCEFVDSLDLTSVLLVSHLPLVGKLVDILCGLTRGYCTMDTATLAYVETELLVKGLGQLRWVHHVGDLQEV